MTPTLDSEKAPARTGYSPCRGSTQSKILTKGIADMTIVDTIPPRVETLPCECGVV